MRSCPACGAQYNDDLTFCLQDGSRLVDAPRISSPSGLPTEEYRADTLVQPPAATQDTVPAIAPPSTPAPKQYKFSAVEPKSRIGCMLVVGQAVAGLLIISGIGAFVVYYMMQSQNVAMNSPAPAPDVKATPVTGISGSNANVAVSDTNSFPLASPSPGQADTNKRTPSPASPRPTNTPAVDEPTPPTRTPVPQPTLTRTVPKVVSGGVLNGKATSLPQPPYPAAARAVRASGAVTVQITIDESGSVTSASAVSGHPLLRPAAVAAARGARFSPTLLSGQPVRVTGVLIYNFRLN
jgi:TonB family protein